MLIYECRAAFILYNLLSKFPKNNKKILIPLNACSIIPLAFEKAGVAFEFVDISQDTLCMDEELTLSILSSNKDTYFGIIFINSYGIDQNVDIFFNKIKYIDKNFFIIDDRCLCIPDTNFSLNAAVADLTLYSTGWSKYIDIGGAFAYLKNTNLEYISETYNETPSWHDCTGLPFKQVEDYFDEINERLPNARAHKEKLNNIYRNKLPNNIQYNEKYHTWRYNIKVVNKSEIMKKIFESNLFASSHYEPMNLVYPNIITHINKDGKSNAEKVYKNIINLFNNHDFSEQMALNVCNIINTTEDNKCLDLN